MLAPRIAISLLLASLSAAAANQGIVPAALALHDATPIRLRLTRDLTVTSVQPGDMVPFEVMDDVRVDGVLVISRGARVAAITIETEPKTRIMGRGGRLGVALDSVPLLNGGKAAIRTAKDRGVEKTADPIAATEAVVPADPSMIFTFGKNETIPDGVSITAYIDGEIQLDPAGFLVDIAFTSKPYGALVKMYGAPIGQTPFTAKLMAGVYKAVFSADGYPDLTQNISVGPGQPNTVFAAFEQKP
jgi:hypothetical protein